MGSKLKVKCIKCGKEWEKDSKIKWKENDITGPLCDNCFRVVVTPVIHKKQRREGNFDCFGKAINGCDQNCCKYRNWCIRYISLPHNNQHSYASP